MLSSKSKDCSGKNKNQKEQALFASQVKGEFDIYGGLNHNIVQCKLRKYKAIK